MDSCSTYSEGGSRTALIVFLFLLPWILSDVLLIPLYIDGMSKVSGTWRTTCDINMGGYLTRTLLIVSFFPQVTTSLEYYCMQESIAENTRIARKF